MTASQTRSRLLVVGDRWQFDLSREAGPGGHGKTFVGRDLRDDAPVVVKVMWRQGADPDALKRFLREMELHAGLEHEAILPLLGCGSDPECHYIVTPLIEPGALWKVVTPTDGPVERLGLARTAAVAERILGALIYLHEDRAEVHGDVSPGNILIDGDQRAFLADFGVAKRLADHPATSSDRFGTRGFEAPRKLGTKRTYEDDVYSMACVLWFCLVGSPPDRLGLGEQPPEKLRVPLERALTWGSVPTARELRAALREQWSDELRRDWRRVSSRLPRSRAPLVAAGLAGVLALAALAGRELPAKPAAAARSEVPGERMTLHLVGDWRARRATPLTGVSLRSTVSAQRGATRVTAGVAPPAGTALIGRPAIRALPPAARKPRRVVVGDAVALRYGPTATASGRGVEILAMPLRSRTLVVWCEGPTTSLRAACAQTAADLELHEGALQPLGPRRALATDLRAATAGLNRRRGKALARMASAADGGELAAAAGAVGNAYADFAKTIGRLRANAHERDALATVGRTARATATAYAELATAATDAEWRAGRGRAIARERRLSAATRRLSELGYATRR